MNPATDHSLPEKDWQKNLETDSEFVSERSAAILLAPPKGAKLLLWVICIFVLIALGWATQTELDEVALGVGKVIPSQQLQVLQNLEGGIVSEVLVREGDTVEKGDVLLRIENSRSIAGLMEIRKKLQGLYAMKSRLLAEIDHTKLNFPDNLETDFPELVLRERELYNSRVEEFGAMQESLGSQIKQVTQEIKSLKDRRKHLEKSLQFSQQELNMTVPLVADGAVAEIEVVHLQKSHNELSGNVSQIQLEIPRLEMRGRELSSKRDEKELEFRNEARKELNAVMTNIATLSEAGVAAEDRVHRSEVRSPVRGIVQRILVNTITSVVQPGTNLVELVPLDDSLVIEAKIRPTDIAFVQPGQKVFVRFNAYDFTVYGGVEGTLEHLSADSVNDEDESYYLGRIRMNPNGENKTLYFLEIMPGMRVTVDILTGKRTVMDYLLKPILRARYQSLRER